jgi:hypothetical protein
LTLDGLVEAEIFIAFTAGGADGFELPVIVLFGEDYLM